MTSVTDSSQFVSRVRPLLEAKDTQGLLNLLHTDYTCDQITGLLQGPNLDARKIAALCLSLVGDECAIELLADQLHNADVTVNQMAEHALWSIWFRLGSPEANLELCRGSKALGAREFVKAVQHFKEAIELAPSFAEPFNQWAIACYLQDDYAESIEHCLEAVKRMPCHFGAWAGMGHCYLHLHDLPSALRCYRKALEINPHLDCVLEASAAIERDLIDHPEA